jgi:hypothetical protein
VAGVLGVKEPVSGDENVELPGVALDALGKAGGGQHLIEGVAQMLEVAVEVVAVTVEEVLQALEQIRRGRDPNTSGLDT